MKLIEFNIESNTIKIERGFFGTECVFLNGSVISKKRTLFGTTHDINVDHVNYQIKYTVKDWWKKWTGQPTFELRTGDTIISEYRIQNPTFFSIQFFLSLSFFYILATLFWIFIESAKRGFVYNAH